jgi:hypothetical protein
MLSRCRAHERAGEHAAHYDLDHLDKGSGVERAAGDTPQVELVRLADMQPIDRVAAIRQTRAHQQHVVVVCRGDRAQRARDHRGRLGAKQTARRHVPRVTRVARRGIRRIAQIVVVVGDADERGRSIDDHGALPALAQRRDRILHKQLERVRTRRSVGQIAQCQRSPITLTIDESNRHDTHLVAIPNGSGCQRSGGDGEPRTASGGQAGNAGGVKLSEEKSTRTRQRPTPEAGRGR